ncbi:MAG: alanyl-tRNA editing protein [Alphaproteobacteria bacterium]|nr:alanyl-tRNA editing protein [Alphaproteobacteria bacterium]
MTEKVFWQDPYLAELGTCVAQVAGDQITVERTIFYAKSGGQESDHGTIAGQPVQAARKDGREIFYSLPSGHGLEPGDPVHMTIDWDRRYRLMRLHFAAEVVLELVTRKLATIEKIGAHISEDKARIDFRWDENISAQFAEIERDVASIVAGNQAIESAFSDEAAEQRYWKIREFARVPCGGTHLKRTGEIGAIALKRKNIGKGKERIEIYLSTDKPRRPMG